MNAGTRAFRQGVAVARVTFSETIRQPLAFLLFLTALLTTLIVPIFQFHRFGEPGRLARDGGCSALFVFGLVFVLAMAGRAVDTDIVRGTAAVSLSKPVHRSVYLVSKWLGLMAAVCLFASGVTLASGLAEIATAGVAGHQHSATCGCVEEGRIFFPVFALSVGMTVFALAAAAAWNFYSRRRFGVAAFVGLLLAQAFAVVVAAWRWGTFINMRVLPVMVLLFTLLAVFAAFAIAVATFAPTAVVFMAGALLAVVSIAGVGFAPAMRGVVYAVAPDFQNFWLCDAIANGGSVAWRYVAEAIGAACALTALYLGAACVIFHHRDLS